MAELSSKREQIEVIRSRMITIASISIFVVIFSLSSAYSLWTRMNFQNNLISAKKIARNQLSNDIQTSNQLTSSYKSFINTPTNLLGNNVTGVQNNNAKIILDALPSSYDFPALTTSVQNILSNQGVTIDSIGGTEQSSLSQSTSTVATPIPFTFSIDGPYQNIQNVINTIEKSIRPFQIQTISLSGNQSDVTLSATAQSFFQPPVKFKITTRGLQP
jgi:Tfp pilus assembly protein PilO